MSGTIYVDTSAFPEGTYIVKMHGYNGIGNALMGRNIGSEKLIVVH